jgi:two-component system NtrC family sensor kinase
MAFCGFCLRDGVNVAKQVDTQNNAFMAGAPDLTGIASRMSPADVAALSQAFKMFTDSTAKMSQMYERLQEEVVSLKQELEHKNRELEQASRLASLGELAAGVAHEIRNPLGGIELCASLLQRQPGVDDRCREITGNIVTGVKRINAIVVNLLTFARDIKVVARRMDLKPVLGEARAAMASIAEGGNVTIIATADGNQPLWIRGDPGQLRQVFINIMQNAVDAMTGGGTLNIDVGCRECQQTGRRLVHIGFRDTGVGMLPEVMEKIFNPFFTTRENGTGLGLAISYRIVENHGGRMTVDSREGEGTCFTIQLPLLNDETAETPCVEVA